MAQNSNDILIGRVAAPFGIKGEVKIVVLTDFPERFDSGRKAFLILKDGSRKEMEIQQRKDQNGGVVVKFFGVETRNDAEAIRNADVVIDQNDLAELGEGEYYVFEIMGLEVVTSSGKVVGKVDEVLQGGANDVYVTDTGVCIPVIESVIENIDIKNKKIVINPIPGLLADEN